MKERERPGGRPSGRDKLGGDISGPTQGDLSSQPDAGFTDWDNPEDEPDYDDYEDAPEGYYDDEEEIAEEDEWYEPDPGDPDYDLSEAAGYSGYEPRRSSGIPEWLVVAVSLLLILALLLPALLRLS